MPSILVDGVCVKVSDELFLPANIAANIPPKAKRPNRAKSQGLQQDVSALGNGTGGETTADF